MAELPKLRSMRLEDFSDAPEELLPVLQKLVNTLNPFLTDSGNALGNLTIGDNVAGAYRVVEEVTVPLPAWTNATYTTGWSTQPGLEDAAFRLDGCRVYLRGTPATSNTTTYPTPFTLPAGYTPAVEKRFSGWATNGVSAVMAEWAVTSAGAVLWTGTAGTAIAASLEGISFDAAAPATPSGFSGAGWPIRLPGIPNMKVQTVFCVGGRDVNSDAALVQAGQPCWTADTKTNHIIVHRVPFLTPARTYKLAFLLLP